MGHETGDLLMLKEREAEREGGGVGVGGLLDLMNEA